MVGLSLGSDNDPDPDGSQYFGYGKCLWRGSTFIPIASASQIDSDAAQSFYGSGGSIKKR
jgi:hypothetical protein